MLYLVQNFNFIYAVYPIIKSGEPIVPILQYSIISYIAD
jgi:hypothetical protein